MMTQQGYICELNSPDPDANLGIDPVVTEWVWEVLEPEASI